MIEAATAIRIKIPSTIHDARFIYIPPKIWKIKLNTPEAVHATPIWKKAMKSIFLRPSSRLIAERAATQGVYKRQNTSKQKT